MTTFTVERSRSITPIYTFMGEVVEYVPCTPVEYTIHFTTHTTGHWPIDEQSRKLLKDLQFVDLPEDYDSSELPNPDPSMWTLTGSGFGTKTSASPKAFGVTDSVLGTYAGMNMQNTDNLRTSFSTFNARFDFKVPGQGGRGYFGYGEEASSKWFLQYWVKLAPNWHWGTTVSGGGDEGLSNIKFFRLMPDALYANNGYIYNGWDSELIRFFLENNSVDGAYTTTSMYDAFSLNSWHLVQWEYGDSSAVDTADGHTKLMIDGRDIPQRVLKEQFGRASRHVERREKYRIVCDRNRRVCCRSRSNKKDRISDGNRSI